MLVCEAKVSSPLNLVHHRMVMTMESAWTHCLPTLQAELWHLLLRKSASTPYIRDWLSTWTGHFGKDACRE
jgi:hypothetical protein